MTPSQNKSTTESIVLYEEPVAKHFLQNMI